MSWVMQQEICSENCQPTHSNICWTVWCIQNIFNTLSSSPNSTFFWNCLNHWTTVHCTYSMHYYVRVEWFVEETATKWNIVHVHVHCTCLEDTALFEHHMKAQTHTTLQILKKKKRHLSYDSLSRYGVSQYNAVKKLWRMTHTLQHMQY